MFIVCRPMDMIKFIWGEIRIRHDRRGLYLALSRMEKIGSSANKKFFLMMQVVEFN